MKRINVTKTFLPPIEEYQAYLQQIWDNGQVTNQGPLLLELESKLQDYLKVENLHLVSNGTAALQIALNSLEITEGEIITTPFSYVATTSAILWERCQPVFVDIEPDTFCIDATKIEAAITSKTKAILAVHVFGNPCDVEAIEAIAKKHSLKVIYDAAHAFNVEYKGKSLLSYGDISICSFHATKLFHTVEGGCLVTNDPNVSERAELIKRFGHNGDEHYLLGINAKASEMHAAMGLCNLKYVKELIQKRKVASDSYQAALGDSFKSLALREGTTPNYGYYPVVLKDEAAVKKVLKALAEQDIYPRRYFYPSLNELPYVGGKQSCPISEKIANSIICVPLYADLEDAIIQEVCKVLLKDGNG